MNFYARRAETHFVVAGLIPQFAYHHGRAGGRVSRSLKLGGYVKAARKDGQHLAADFDLLRLRIRDLFDLQWAAGPSEFQRDQEFILRLVTVDVKTGENSNIQRLVCRRPSLDGDLRRRFDQNSILLGGREKR
jgi:hypothetical protein